MLPSKHLFLYYVGLYAFDSCLLKVSLKGLQCADYILKSFDARRSRSDCIHSETLQRYSLSCDGHFVQLHCSLCALDSSIYLFADVISRHLWRREIDGIWRRKIKVRTHRRQIRDTRPEERHGRSAPWRDHNRSLRGRGAIK